MIQTFLCYFFNFSKKCNLFGRDPRHFDFWNPLKHISQHSNSLTVSITRKYQYYSSNALVVLTQSLLTQQSHWYIIKLKHWVEYLQNYIRKICVVDVVYWRSTKGMHDIYLYHFIKLFDNTWDISTGEENCSHIKPTKTNFKKCTNIFESKLKSDFQKKLRYLLHWKSFKNDKKCFFYFTLKALFVLKLFKFLSSLFSYAEAIVLLERKD